MPQPLYGRVALVSGISRHPPMGHPRSTVGSPHPATRHASMTKWENGLPGQLVQLPSAAEIPWPRSMGRRIYWYVIISMVLWGIPLVWVGSYP